jgi:hypothetical protein
MPASKAAIRGRPCEGQVWPDEMRERQDEVQEPLNGLLVHLVSDFCYRWHSPGYP